MTIHCIRPGDPLDGLTRRALVAFLHSHLKPYEDTAPDIERGIEYALSAEPGRGGFVLLALEERRLLGALVMLRTGMQGYIPPNLLLFVAVDRDRRGQGIGRRLCTAAVEACPGDVCLHVEYENPARRLYERLGFQSRYAEMRLAR